VKVADDLFIGLSLHISYLHRFYIVGRMSGFTKKIPFHTGAVLAENFWGLVWPLEGIDCRAPETTTAQQLKDNMHCGT